MFQVLISLYLVMESPDKTSTLHIALILYLAGHVHLLIYIFIISEYATAFLTVVAFSLVFKTL